MAGDNSGQAHRPDAAAPSRTPFPYRNALRVHVLAGACITSCFRSLPHLGVVGADRSERGYLMGVVEDGP